jgi:uncharacterized protein involved in response to NO
MRPDPETRQNRAWHLRQIWDAPHRPLFLASFVWAALTVMWWPLGDALGVPPPFEPAVLWHVHELLFGFAAAAMGGYVLTALPSWTAADPLSGPRLQWLILLWAMARLATLFVFVLPLPVVFVANSGYFLLLAAVLCRAILSARAYRKLGFPIAVLFLCCGELLYLTAAIGGRPWDSLAIARVAVLGFALLIISVGGRAIPAFTRNWFLQTGQAHQVVSDAPRSIRLAQGFVVAAIAGRGVGIPDLTHAALIGAALASLRMMHGWRTVPALTNPLLAALHLAFLWVPVGLGMTGILGFFPDAYPAADAIHTLTIGAMSGLIMAISGRAAAHQDSGGMKAGFGFVIGVALIWLATCVRLLVPLSLSYGSGFLMVSAVLWCTGWAAFIAGFLPALFGTVIRPVFSGKKFRSADTVANSLKNEAK